MTFKGSVLHGILTRSDVTTYASQIYHESAEIYSFFVHFEGRRRRNSGLQKDPTFFFILFRIGSTENNNVVVNVP